MMLMPTFGALKEVDSGDTARTVMVDGKPVRTTFKYHEPFYNHFKFCHQVDDHNNQHHSPISFEETWMTKDWRHRVFAFIIAITEVNARIAYAHFNQLLSMSQFEFRCKLAKELIDMSFDSDSPIKNTRKRTRAAVSPLCREESVPTYAGQWNGNSWEPAKTEYLQHVCKGVNCKKRIRSYCKCNKGHWLCKVCIRLLMGMAENTIANAD